MATTSLRVKMTQVEIYLNWLTCWLSNGRSHDLSLFTDSPSLSGWPPADQQAEDIRLHRRWPTSWSIKRFHSRDQHLCKCIETKGSVYIRKEFNSLRICSVHQHGRRFIVLEHQYGRRDVKWKRPIGSTIIHVQSYFLFFFLQKLTTLHQMLMRRSVIIADHKRE